MSIDAQIHTDHDRANTELEAIARRKGIPLDSTEPTEATELKSKLTACGRMAKTTT